jgi:hypothetical protein
MMLRSANTPTIERAHRNKLQRFFGESEFPTTVLTPPPSADEEIMGMSSSVSAGKLQKIFGEVPILQRPALTPTWYARSSLENAWIRSANSSRGDLILNMEGNGQVKAGTLDALVEKLTAPDCVGMLFFTRI